MNQLMFDMPTYGPWIRTHSGDQSGRLLADRHYSRQTIGHVQWNRPGKKLVFRTADGMAVWVTWLAILLQQRRLGHVVRLAVQFG